MTGDPTPGDDSGDDCVIVVAGGSAPRPDTWSALPTAAYVIAADSGLGHALALGLRADVVVGDLDSVSDQALAAAAEQGTVVERHPEAKDQTDLELALDRAAARRPGRILVLGAAGGRLDHLLAGALLMADERYAGIRVEARLGPALVTVVRAEAQLSGVPGELVSLLPVHGPAWGVRTEGLLYPLHDEDLRPGTSRGVSNELVGNRATVHVRQGVLLAVQPGEAGTHLHRGVPR
jgi:thiamine pyrophosphokinase